MADPQMRQAPKPGRQGNAFAQIADGVKKAALQADATGRWLSSASTFGQADRVGVAANAFFEPGGLAGWGARYKADRALQEARDRYEASQGLTEPAMQIDTAARSAANTLTFGAADRLMAFQNASLDPDGLAGWGDRYKAELALREARNRYDASHRQIAQGVGAVGGTAAGLLALGPMDGVLAGGTRLAGAAKLTAPEAGIILGAGGAIGGVSQGVSDAVRGHVSSLGDYAGSAIGGAAGTGAMLLGAASRAGAVDGAVTSVAQDLLNGRPVELNQAGQAALAGNLLAGAAGRAGQRWSNGLSMQAKGKLGEDMGGVRSMMNGEFRASGKAHDPVEVNGRQTYWVPDGRSGDIRFEDKFGPSARLSPNQRAARNVLGDNFRLNSFLPADVGNIFATPLLSTPPLLVTAGVPAGNPPGAAGSQPSR